MPVTVIAGPPAAGKSTWIREHAEPGDLVVDFDLPYRALTGGLCAKLDNPPALRPYVLAARRAILKRLLTAPAGSIRHAWLIHGAPHPAERDAWRQRFAAHVIVLATPPDVCLARCAADPDRRHVPAAEWEAILDAWWTTYRTRRRPHLTITGRNRHTDHMGGAGLIFPTCQDTDRKSTRLNSSHIQKSRMPSSA